MCKIWMSACIVCIVVTMGISNASAHIRVSSKVQLLVGVEGKTSNLDNILVRQYLLEGKLSQSQSVKQLDHNLLRPG